MANMTPARMSRGSVPSEALRKGTANESPSAAEKETDGAPVGDGPKISSIGGHLPASYKCSSGIRTDR